MSQRRMFSPSVVCSDAFLEMPSSGRDLYYQLGMYADDDGFVNPRKVMRMIGSSEDDLKILIVKRFVIPFPSGVLVIKHWKINNLVRKDWYRPTQYVEEKGKLYLKENGAYTDDPANGVPLVNESLTQVRLGKYNKYLPIPNSSVTIRETEPLAQNIAALLGVELGSLHEVIEKYSGKTDLVKLAKELVAYQKKKGYNWTEPVLKQKFYAWATARAKASPTSRAFGVIYSDLTGQEVK